MRKIFLFALLFVLAICMPALAATNAKSASLGQGILTVAGIGDLSSGNTAEVDSDGDLRVSEVSTIAVSSGVTLNTGVALVSTACKVQGITISGASSTVLDSILIYDAASATGTPKYDISIGTAGETVSLNTHGATFSTGVFADASASNMHITIEYNN